MKKNQGLAVIPLVVIIVLVGVAGFAIFSWVKTNNQATADKEVAEQREKELKAVLEDAQQEAEENAKKADELQDTLTKTEEAMKLAEEKAKKDAEEKAAMLADLEEKLEVESVAKTEAEEKSAALSEEIASLQESIEEAKDRESVLRATLAGGITRINPKATQGLSVVSDSVASQKAQMEKIKALLANADGPIAASELEALIRSFEDGLVAAEKGASGLSRDLVKSGEFSSSSSVGQAIADLQQTTMKQRAILNSLKSMLANSGETIDPAKVQAMIADLESSISELEQRQASLDETISAEASAGLTDGSSALADFQRKIKQSQVQMASLQRQLAEAEAAKTAAIERQMELEKLSIEIKYDIDYEARSMSYARRLHSMYDSVANPKAEQ